LRGLVTVERWWIAGMDMLALGVAVAAAAYASGGRSLAVDLARVTAPRE